ncbi:MAG: carbon-nitrogen hydrolase family protein [Spirochaetia bacterium]
MSGCADNAYLDARLYDIYSAPVRYDDSAAELRYEAASVCMRVSKDPVKNLETVTGLIDTIMTENPGTDLIVFGETSLGWYFDRTAPRKYQLSVAETVPGPATGIIGEKAADYRVNVVLGMTERTEENSLYNSLVLINKQGEVQAVHRKVYMTGFDKRSSFNPGEGAAIVSIDGIRTAMLICADWHDPELTEQIQQADVDLFILSLADLAEDIGYHFNPIPRMADAWMIYANRCGTEGGIRYPGINFIADPAGNLRKMSTGVPGYIHDSMGIYRRTRP